MINNETPYERLLKQPPDYTSLRVFGCACWPNLRPYNTRKLQFCSKRYVFLGYSNQHKGFKCLDPLEGRVYISRDVVFDESIFPFNTLHPNAGARLRAEISLLPESLLNSSMHFGDVNLSSPHACNSSPDVGITPGRDLLVTTENAEENEADRCISVYHRMCPSTGNNTVLLRLGQIRARGGCQRRQYRLRGPSPVLVRRARSTPHRLQCAPDPLRSTPSRSSRCFRLPCHRRIHAMGACACAICIDTGRSWRGILWGHGSYDSDYYCFFAYTSSTPIYTVSTRYT